MRSCVLSIIVVAAFPALLLAAGSTPLHCSEFKAVVLPGFALEIDESEWLPAAVDPSGSGAQLPAYCRVDGLLNRRTGVNGIEFAIGFALALPEDWNGDFLMQGGGGLNGFVAPPVGAGAAGSTPALARHFAVVTTDTGHKAARPFDPSFFKDQQASLDFAYQAIGKVTEVAKRLIFSYYGQDAAFSYFVGCSTGGREAMIMTQRYPSYFNGVVAGAPAMRTGFSNLADRWVTASLNRGAQKNVNGDPVKGGILSDADRRLIVDGLLKRCDARDGLADGMIFDVQGCDFDPATLQCSAAKTDSCLTAEQVSDVKRAFAGPVDSRGFQVYPGFFYDTGIAAKKGIPGLLNAAAGPVGPAKPTTEVDVDAEERRAPNPLVDSVYANVSTFSGRGSKLIFYHGVSDPWFSARDTLDYYNRMAEENGGREKVAGWSRLFLVPGMGHCGGGEAALDSFDMLSAIVNWVEKGGAPESVVATGKAFPGRSRPLCAYPKHALYTGRGDPESAPSFSCQP